MDDAQNIGGGHDDRLWSRLRINYDKLGPIEQEAFLAIVCTTPLGVYSYPMRIDDAIYDKS